MKALNVVFILILFIIPIGIHQVDSSNTTYMMTPLGAVSVRDNEFEVAFYNFNWFSEDGRWDYAGDALSDRTKLFAILYVSDIEISFIDIDNNLSTEGLLTLIIPYLLLAALLLLFIPGAIGAFIADILILGTTIMGFVSYLTFIDRYGSNYDTIFPIYAIVGLIFTILSLIIAFRTIKQNKKRKKKRRR